MAFDMLTRWPFPIKKRINNIKIIKMKKDRETMYLKMKFVMLHVG